MQTSYPSFVKLAHDAKAKPTPAGRDYASAAAKAATTGGLVYAETHAGTFVLADGAPVSDSYSYLVLHPKTPLVRS